ncbi:MAG: DNA topoisomerase IV subunit A [Geminicoccaceae bacterium]|nr:DNA topoisomerase IV subunit A [Geminicoccaceae bacterium]
MSEGGIVERIEPTDFSAALGERYLAYALSTITARSLPDLRDGLKPVQRRLLWAMLQLRLDPSSAFKKSARVVGDVIGKYHPHGDAAVYEALVRLAQDFAQRYPLVEGQGNFGNVDGDGAAAMRYTEARLTPVAMALLEGIDRDTVDFRPTYDGSEREPVVLPAAFPNLLANGATGIAVGMATSIPPHNAGELFDALAWMLSRPADAPPPTAEELLRFVKGPDLPTGGVIVETPAVLAEVYRTGRGSLRLRARWHREDLAYGQYQLVVTEIPWLVQKGRLVERIAELLVAKRLPLLADFRDESTDTVRLVFVPRSRSVPAEALAEQLFKLTELEVRLAVNMNVLDARGVPRVMSLAQLLEGYLAHRMEVLERESRFRLREIADRLELVEGYLRIFLDIEGVIRIVREEDEPKPALMAAFGLSERQAEAILNLRLRNLRRLEEEELRREAARLQRERAELEHLLSSESARRKKLRAEMLEGKKRFGSGALGARRTSIAEPPEVDPSLLEAPVERYPVTVLLSEKGWIRALKGKLEPGAEVRYKEGDGPRFVLEGHSTDRLLVLTADGKAFTLSIDKLPGGRGTGEPLSLFLDLAKGVPIVAARILRPEGRLVLGTRKGFGFVVREAAIAAQTRAGRQIVDLAENDALRVAAPVEGDLVVVSGTNHKILVFPLAELPERTRGRGSVLMRLGGAELADLLTTSGERGIVWRRGEEKHTWREFEGYLGRRGGSGRLAPPGFPEDHRFGFAP